MQKKASILAGVFVALVAFGQAIDWVDEFDGALDPGWRWVRESPSQWTLTERDGFLRIATETGGLLYDSNNARNLLIRDVLDGDYEIETLVYFEPVDDFQIAGLLVYQDDSNFLMLGRAYCNSCGGNKIYMDYEAKGTPVVGKSLSTADKTMAYLRITKEGSTYSGYYSANGTDWTRVGQQRGARIQPIGIGIATTGDAAPTGTQVSADFAYFAIREVSAPATPSTPEPSGGGSRDF